MDKTEVTRFDQTEGQLTKQREIRDQIKEGTYFPELSLLEQEYMDKAKVRQKEGIIKP